MSEEYNGHPSYEHWNVSLWVGNDEGLYRLARSFDNAHDFWITLRDWNYETPDGVKVTAELAVYAWESVQDEE